MNQDQHLIPVDLLRKQETDRELVLRFFAMLDHMAEYRMPLSNFLNDEADRGIQLTEHELQQRREVFERALSNVSAAPFPLFAQILILQKLLQSSIPNGCNNCDRAAPSLKQLFFLV